MCFVLANLASCSLWHKLHGAAYGKGIYLSPISSISFGYSGMGKGQHHMPTKEELVQHYNRVNTVLQCRPTQSRFLQSRNLNCVALCEVITSKDLQKHGNIWVCPISDHVCTRFFFVYEDGQVGDANINTQDVRIQKEILRVTGGQPAWLLPVSPLWLLWDIFQGNVWTEYGKDLPQTNVRCFWRR